MKKRTRIPSVSLLWSSLANVLTWRISIKLSNVSWKTMLIRINQFPTVLNITTNIFPFAHPWLPISNMPTSDDSTCESFVYWSPMEPECHSHVAVTVFFAFSVASNWSHIWSICCVKQRTAIIRVTLQSAWKWMRKRRRKSTNGQRRRAPWETLSANRSEHVYSTRRWNSALIKRWRNLIYPSFFKITYSFRMSDAERFTSFSISLVHRYVSLNNKRYAMSHALT